MRLARLRPAWERSSDRWASFWEMRSAREQLLLGALAAVALVALLMAAVVRPLESARARAAADIRTYDMLAIRLKAAGARAATGGGGPPAQVVARAATAAGVVVQRIEPAGARTSIVLADAPFDAAVRFVAEIERGGALRVAEARIDRGQAGGSVAASFLLAGGG